MNVVVMHQFVAANASVDDRDVLVQRDAVVAALKGLGHAAQTLAITLDLESARNQLLEMKPAVVFNLVESLGGTDRLMALATMLLDAIEIPYTGASTNALLTTSNKLTAKASLRDAGLPTPNWLTREAFADVDQIPRDFAAGPWIIKPVLEHASFGIDDASVVQVREARELQHELREREQATERPHFAEQFIDGREFNLSVLAGEVLPPAEIDFVSFPPEKPKIVGHLAKWDVDSFEYQQTPRRFELAESDGGLLDELAGLSVGCWDWFGLNGYARVDFRVDDQGRPTILEINANPCLSPDAGFAAAVVEAGLSFEDAVQRILDDVNS